MSTSEIVMVNTKTLINICVTAGIVTPFLLLMSVSSLCRYRQRMMSTRADNNENNSNEKRTRQPQQNIGSGKFGSVFKVYWVKQSCCCTYGCRILLMNSMLFANER